MPSKVNVYTQPGCGHCVQTKKLLDKLNIEYVEVDVVDNPEQRDKIKTVWGFTQVPVVETEDDVWSGHRPERIKELVG